MFDRFGSYQLTPQAIQAAQLGAFGGAPGAINGTPLAALYQGQQLPPQGIFGIPLGAPVGNSMGGVFGAAHLGPQIGGVLPFQVGGWNAGLLPLQAAMLQHAQQQYAQQQYAHLPQHQHYGQVPQLQQYAQHPQQQYAPWLPQQQYTQFPQQQPYAQFPQQQYGQFPQASYAQFQPQQQYPQLLPQQQPYAQFPQQQYAQLPQQYLQYPATPGSNLPGLQGLGEGASLRTQPVLWS